MKSFFISVLTALGLMCVLPAYSDPACIFVSNGTAKSIIYNQYPDDYGETLIKPGKNSTPCEASHKKEYISVYTQSPSKDLSCTNAEFVSGSGYLVLPGHTIKCANGKIIITRGK